MTSGSRRSAAAGFALTVMMNAGTHAATQIEAPVASTTSGLIRGYNDGPVKVFKGVPYGAPTGGANRWLPPKPPLSWSDIKDTIAAGPMSPQHFGAPMPEETAMIQARPMSEDCLNLNVFTPAIGPHSGRRPVMVWLHGGGFAAGSGNATSYDGRNLVAKQDVVLVTVSHRLNAFGFLYLADLFGPAYADSGNVGMLDVVAALRWVQDNIAQFGGDPTQVTIFGQSGGGAKVSTLMAMPKAKGLFVRAIAESGAAIRSTEKTEAAAAAQALIDELGVKTLAELQAVPDEKLVAAVGTLHWRSGPVLDGKNLPTHPFDPAAPALSRGIPFLVGTTETEAVFFPTTPLDPIDDAKFRQIVTAATGAADPDVERLIAVFKHAYPGKDATYLCQLLLSQITFQEGTTTLAERKADQAGAPVYVYYFTKHTMVREGKLRAPHTLEIPYVFDSLGKSAPIIGPPTAAEQALADKVSATWAAFARAGDPNNPKIPHWSPFDTQTRKVMLIDDDFRLAEDPLRETRLAILELRRKAAADKARP